MATKTYIIPTKTKRKYPKGLTTVYLHGLLNDVRKHNKTHPFNKINVSELSRKAVYNELKRINKKGDSE